MLDGSFLALSKRCVVLGRYPYNYRNFRYNLGPTPRTITNCIKNSFIPRMFFFPFFLSRDVALLFLVALLDRIPIKALQSPM